MTTPNTPDSKQEALWPNEITIIRYDDGGFSATTAIPPKGAKFAEVYVRRAPLAAVGDDGPTIYADGYCARCSELAYPLTRALEKTGVPTGADNWQQTYGPNKVRALADFESCLRRLLNTLDEGKPEEIADRIQWAKHFIEFHAEVRRRLTAKAQQASTDAAAASSAPAERPPTPEQIVYNVAQRDPRFRKYLIEQLTAMGDEQDIGPLRTLQPLQPEGEQEPSLEDLAGEAAALLEQLNGINGDAVLLRANQVAFALRAGIKSSRQRHNLARADGYNDGFRQGKQSRATLPPETPSDAAMRAAREIVEKTKCDEYRGGPHRTIMAADAVAAIITRHLAAQDELVDEVQRRMDQVVEAAVEWHQAGREGVEWFDAAERLSAAINSLLELKSKPDAAATTSPETPVGGEPRICLTCGHEERFSDNEGGTCEKIVDEESNFCGCVCRFAAPVHAAGDDERGRLPVVCDGCKYCIAHGCHCAHAAALRSGGES